MGHEPLRPSGALLMSCTPIAKDGRLRNDVQNMLSPPVGDESLLLACLRLDDRTNEVRLSFSHVRYPTQDPNASRTARMLCKFVIVQLVGYHIYTM